MRYMTFSVNACDRTSCGAAASCTGFGLFGLFPYKNLLLNWLKGGDFYTVFDICGLIEYKNRLQSGVALYGKMTDLSERV